MTSYREGAVSGRGYLREGFVENVVGYECGSHRDFLPDIMKSPNNNLDCLYCVSVSDTPEAHNGI